MSEITIAKALQPSESTFVSQSAPRLSPYSHNEPPRAGYITQNILLRRISLLRLFDHSNPPYLHAVRVGWGSKVSRSAALPRNVLVGLRFH